MRLVRLFTVLAITASCAMAQTQTVLYPGMSGASLRSAIRADYTPASTPGYNAARDLLWAYEQNADGELCGVYTRFCIQLTPGADPSSDAFAKGINAEHNWPQAFGASAEPARGDMNNLFPSRIEANSDRANFPFAEIPDADTDRWLMGTQTQTTIPTSSLGDWSELDQQNPTPGFSGRFEPRHDHKGNAARSAFYFATIYASQVSAAGGDAFFEAQAEDLLAWHYGDPVDAREDARGQWIATQQGTMNPFLLDSTLARRAFELTTTEPPPPPPPTPGASVWVNEIHYDNTGTDAGEGIEVAGPAGTALTGWALVLYNGNGGAVYDTFPLSGTLADQQNGFGTAWTATLGLQNGGPDGIALVDPSGSVVQFLSYEGTFTAVGGPADGLVSVDIGVQESSTTPVGESLQLVGEGSASDDFTWAGPMAATEGQPNTGQTFATPPPTGVSILIDDPKGFRFLGTPSAGLTVDDLAAMNLVRGVPGYYASANPPNLETTYDATTGKWIPSTGTGEVLELGRAFRWRFYDHANGNPTISQSVPLPMTLSTDLPANTADVTVDLATDGNRFTFLANPFGTDLDLSGIATWPGGDNLPPAAPIWTYDPVAKSFVTAPATIPAWMGFRVRAKPDGPRSITIPASAAVAGARMAAREEATPPGLRFTLDGTDADGSRIADRGFAIVFSDDARAAFDADEDAEKLQVPAETYALLGARVGDTFVGYDARPFAAAEIPLAVEARGTASRFTLSWDAETLPAGLPVSLVDLQTGAEVDVRTQSSVSFEARTVAAFGDVIPSDDLADPSSATDRFVLRIGTSVASATEATVTLTSIAPNPSTGSARVSFALPEAGPVRLTVIDVRGRSVATLVDGPLGAGRHEATLDSGSLAAGVYMVRLEGGGSVVTRQAVVVR
ncbi:hypothetical protein B1759_13885 [Rubrivirga sp. SAORIC476]|uniref:endonuclease n=1 Tax=Rubrivirga sp. SAORIC476 TaxID=1961794 RepID=UPI000BA8F1F9|nr:endonuclease [Rubrivirga sp. SAORIC476]PAP79415.1 hypothetical protein B1759_13885 [Rubrivirga sp. SAORIC476]